MGTLDELIGRLKGEDFKPILVAGYPNIDLVGSLDEYELEQLNQGLNLDEHISFEENCLKFKGRAIKLGDTGYYLEKPKEMIDSEGIFVKALMEGKKYTSSECCTTVIGCDCIEVPIPESGIGIGGGISNSLLAFWQLFGESPNYNQMIYSIAPVGKGETFIKKKLKEYSNALLFEIEGIGPRVNWVIPSCTLKGAVLIIKDRIIIKHPAQEISLGYDEYKQALDSMLSGKHISTIFINGSKSSSDIENAIKYSGNKGTHLVSVVTDSTARLDNISELLSKSTYIANNEELGVLCNEKTSEKECGTELIDPKAVLNATRTLRERQGETPQNIYVTLGESGSISLDRGGNATWVGIYSSAWAYSPNKNGFGDTFAAGIALAENTDRTIQPVDAQIFATALVSSKIRSPEQSVEHLDEVRNLITYNHVPVIYLGKLDSNHVYQMSDGNVQRLADWFKIDPFIRNAK